MWSISESLSAEEFGSDRGLQAVEPGKAQPAEPDRSATPAGMTPDNVAMGPGSEYWLP